MSVSGLIASVHSTSYTIKSPRPQRRLFIRILLSAARARSSEVGTSLISRPIAPCSPAYVKELFRKLFSRKRRTRSDPTLPVTGSAQAHSEHTASFESPAAAVYQLEPVTPTRSISTLRISEAESPLSLGGDFSSRSSWARPSSKNSPAIERSRRDSHARAAARTASQQEELDPAAESSARRFYASLRPVSPSSPERDLPIATNPVPQHLFVPTSKRNTTRRSIRSHASPTMPDSEGANRTQSTTSAGDTAGMASNNGEARRLEPSIKVPPSSGTNNSEERKDSPAPVMQATSGPLQDYYAE
ncbi:hypothetical protein ANO11243_073880 [Dothideomycetidae sp. 11243]|nr:hypothetical protein ANO11243_073880 [fungal sp. No.11243]